MKNYYEENSNWPSKLLDNKRRDSSLESYYSHHQSILNNRSPEFIIKPEDEFSDYSIDIEECKIKQESPDIKFHKIKKKKQIKQDNLTSVNDAETIEVKWPPNQREETKKLKNTSKMTEVNFKIDCKQKLKFEVIDDESCPKNKEIKNRGSPKEKVISILDNDEPEIIWAKKKKHKKRENGIEIIDLLNNLGEGNVHEKKRKKRKHFQFACEANQRQDLYFMENEDNVAKKPKKKKTCKNTVTANDNVDNCKDKLINEQKTVLDVDLEQNINNLDITHENVPKKKRKKRSSTGSNDHVANSSLETNTSKIRVEDVLDTMEDPMIQTTEADNSCDQVRKKKKKRKHKHLKLDDAENLEVSEITNECKSQIAGKFIKKDDDEQVGKKKKKNRKRKSTEIEDSFDKPFENTHLNDSNSQINIESGSKKLNKSLDKLDLGIENIVEDNAKVTENNTDSSKLAPNKKDHNSKYNDHQINSNKSRRIKKNKRDTDSDYESSDSLNSRMPNLVYSSVYSDSDDDDLMPDTEEIYLNNLVIDKLDKVPILHRILVSSAPPTKDQLKKVADMGITIKTGKFNNAEDDTVKRNWETFVERYQAPNKPELFFCFIKDHKWIFTKENIINFKQFISTGLDNRTINSVYNRFKRIFSVDMFKNGRYTPEEDQVILDYLETCKGNHIVTALARKLNRSTLSIEKRIKLLTRDKNEEIVRWGDKNMAVFLRRLLKVTKCTDYMELKDRKIKCEEWLKMRKKLKLPVKRLRRAWFLTMYPLLFMKDNTVNLKTMFSKIIERLDKNEENDWRAVDWKSYSAPYEGFTPAKVYQVLKNIVKIHVPKRYQSDLRASVRHLIKKSFSFRNNTLHKVIYQDGKIVRLEKKPS